MSKLFAMSVLVMQKDEILEYARQIDADLIAIASHRPNVSSFLLIRLNSIIYCSPCKNVGIGDPLVKKPFENKGLSTQ